MALERLGKWFKVDNCFKDKCDVSAKIVQMTDSEQGGKGSEP